MTTVVHYKKENWDVYIGRPSKWGNPFTIGKDGTREEVIQKYRKWIVTQPHLLRALPELKNKVLGCWCTPNPCHGDVLAELVEIFVGTQIRCYRDDCIHNTSHKANCGFCTRGDISFTSEGCMDFQT